MTVRNWAVGVLTTAAVVGGIVLVQSGPGQGVLPIARHSSAVPAAPDGPGLPAPGEAGAAAPTAGTVHQAPAVVRPAATVARAPGRDDHSGKGKSAEDSGKRKSDGKGKGSGDDHGSIDGKGKGGSDD
ncbi:MAG TPA: hypothetical protein VGP36_18125 [Mycobacteriales bacterium]|jgi:hypothetical protein|nr:hypothetical protein [Mycobacteriales bacterium]